MRNIYLNNFYVLSKAQYLLISKSHWILIANANYRSTWYENFRFKNLFWLDSFTQFQFVMKFALKCSVVAILIEIFGDKTEKISPLNFSCEILGKNSAIQITINFLAEIFPSTVLEVSRPWGKYFFSSRSFF